MFFVFVFVFFIDFFFLFSFSFFLFASDLLFFEIFRYIGYFLHMVGLLTHNGITPLIVFDGNRLPAKSLQEEERHK